MDKLEIDSRQAAAQKLQARSLTDNVRLQSGTHYIPVNFFDPEYLRHLYFSSEGRTNRLRYFLGHLFLFGVTIVGFIILTFLSILGYMVPLIGDVLQFSFWILWVSFAVGAGIASVMLGIKRMHDLNGSGWFTIFLFVPIVNLVMGILLLFLPGTAGPNRFGDDNG